MRALADLTYRARLQPAAARLARHGPGRADDGHERARTQLGWTPRHTSEQALLELLEGMRSAAGLDTPPLRPRAGGPLRIRELLTGLGRQR